MFPRDEFRQRGMITYAEAMASRHGRWAEVAGPVLVRQRAGLAKSVMFIAVEDETGVANVVAWMTKTFKSNQRADLDVGMLGVRSRIQREEKFVYVGVHTMTNLSQE